MDSSKKDNVYITYNEEEKKGNSAGEINLPERTTIYGIPISSEYLKIYKSLINQNILSILRNLEASCGIVYNKLDNKYYLVHELPDYLLIIRYYLKQKYPDLVLDEELEPLSLITLDADYCSVLYNYRTPSTPIYYILSTFKSYILLKLLEGRGNLYYVFTQILLVIYKYKDKMPCHVDLKKYIDTSVANKYNIPLDNLKWDVYLDDTLITMLEHAIVNIIDNPSFVSSFKKVLKGELSIYDFINLFKNYIFEGVITSLEDWNSKKKLVLETLKDYLNIKIYRSGEIILQLGLFLKKLKFKELIQKNKSKSNKNKKEEDDDKGFIASLIQSINETFETFEEHISEDYVSSFLSELDAVFMLSELMRLLNTNKDIKDKEILNFFIDDSGEMIHKKVISLLRKGLLKDICELIVEKVIRMLSSGKITPFRSEKEENAVLDFIRVLLIHTKIISISSEKELIEVYKKSYSRMIVFLYNDNLYIPSEVFKYLSTPLAVLRYLDSIGATKKKIRKTIKVLSDASSKQYVKPWIYVIDIKTLAYYLNELPTYSDIYNIIKELAIPYVEYMKSLHLNVSTNTKEDATPNNLKDNISSMAVLSNNKDIIVVNSKEDFKKALDTLSSFDPFKKETSNKKEEVDTLLDSFNNNNNILYPAKAEREEDDSLLGD